MKEKKVQSPSSIKTYKQCPRKYYYNYVLKIESPPNIHQVRGNIAHSVLEDFFDIDTSSISLENSEAHLKLTVQQLLLTQWQAYKEKLDLLKLSHDQQIHYFEDTLMMLFNWVELFTRKLAKKQGTFQERFKSLTPIREMLYISETHHAKGFIDAIEHNEDGSVRLMDYKTDSKGDIDKHLLQLAIYSLLYHEKHGVMPTHVGCYFLKSDERTIPVDEKMISMAIREIAHVHEKTSTDDINHYPKSPSPLCKYSSGQCEYYDICRPHER